MCKSLIPASAEQQSRHSLSVLRSGCGPNLVLRTATGQCQAGQQLAEERHVAEENSGLLHMMQAHCSTCLA